MVHCVELDIVSQGRTIEEAQANLKEAVELYLESIEPKNYSVEDGERIIIAYSI